MRVSELFEAEEYSAAYIAGLKHGSEGTGNNMDSAKKMWGTEFADYNKGFLVGRNNKAKNLKAVGQGYGKKQLGEGFSIKLKDGTWYSEERPTLGPVRGGNSQVRVFKSRDEADDFLIMQQNKRTSSKKFEDAEIKRSPKIKEGAEFGAYYYEQLAKKLPAGLKGNAILDAGYAQALKDLGKAKANAYFHRDEDFPSDLVSAYQWWQKNGKKPVKEASESKSEFDARMRRLADQWEKMTDAEKAKKSRIPGWKDQFELALKHVKENPKKVSEQSVSEAAGTWLIKNKDGQEKRFKDGDSPEAKAWKDSSSPKKPPKLAVFSQAYWEKKEGDGVRPLPWTKLTTDDAAVDKITEIVKNQFGDIEFDWTFGQSGAKIIDGVECATVKIRVSYEYGPENDMGFDDRRGDTEYIMVGRNPENPKNIDFLGYSN